MALVCFKSFALAAIGQWLPPQTRNCCYCSKSEVQQPVHKNALVWTWGFKSLNPLPMLISINGDSGIACEIIAFRQLSSNLHHFFKQWLGAARKQTITWVNVVPDLRRHVASLGHNELTTLLRLEHSIGNRSILNGKYANATAADALASCVARTSAATILSMYDKMWPCPPWGVGF